MKVWVVVQYNVVARTFDTKEKAEGYANFMIMVKGLHTYDVKIYESEVE